jgi:hypothetical protein
MSIRDNVRTMKELSPIVASLPADTRNQALRAIAAALRAHSDEIFAANREDLERAELTPACEALLRESEYPEASRRMREALGEETAAPAAPAKARERVPARIRMRQYSAPKMRYFP